MGCAWFNTGVENLDGICHVLEVINSWSDTQGDNNGDMTYRETLWPSPWLFVVAMLELPLLILLIAPFSLALGIAVAVSIYVVIAITLVATSPRIDVTPTHLRVGRASIERAYVGKVAQFSGPLAVAQRGTELDARAWTLFRALIPQVVRVDIIDDDDPTPYWLFSTRNPERVTEALSTVIPRKT